MVVSEIEKRLFEIKFIDYQVVESKEIKYGE